MKLKELCSWLESEVPLSFQEDYDNSGLQTGDPERDIKSALISFEINDAVLEEAIAGGFDLVITHHPLIFKGLRNLTPSSSSGRLVIKAVKNDLAVYSMHTNLDAAGNGVSFVLAGLLGLSQRTVLTPFSNRLLKLVTFVPEAYASKVREAVFNAGAGATGKYDMTSFSSAGQGSFRAGSDAKPFTGTIGSIHHENEIRFETILPSHLRSKVVPALLASHPYEEVAFDLIPLANDYNAAGMGCIGKLESSLNERDFLVLISRILGSESLRYSAPTGRMINRVAVCGGSGSSLIPDAIAARADAFVTGDIRYHNFADAGNNLLVVDAGHYETEKFAVQIIYDLVIKKFPNFALRFSEINTNPINYLKNGKGKDTRS